MESTRITSERPNLGPVFGPVSAEQNERLISTLQRVEERLFAFRDAVATEGRWHCQGITLDTYPSGQASITGYVENEDGLTFGIELAPENFYDGPVWRAGDAPTVMSHEAWDVCGEVWATPDRYGNTAVAEVPSRRYADPEDACDGLIAACARLEELAHTRPLTNDAWLSRDNGS